jgi:hypothetical protein
LRQNQPTVETPYEANYTKTSESRPSSCPRQSHLSSPLYGEEWGAPPPVKLAHRRWGPLHLASYTQHTGHLGRLIHEVLWQLMLRRSQ